MFLVFQTKYLKEVYPKRLFLELGKTVVFFKQYPFAVFGTADNSLKSKTNLFSIK